MKNMKRAAVVGGATLALLVGGVAGAAWLSTGSGDGNVTAGTEQGLTVAGVDGVTGLYPTGSQDLTVNVTNDNPYPVNLDTLAWDGVTPTTDDTDCSGASVTAALKTGQTLDDYIGPGATVGNVFVVTMAADADDACQGATFTLTFDAGASSTAVAP